MFEIYLELQANEQTGYERWALASTVELADAYVPTLSQYLVLICSYFRQPISVICFPINQPPKDDEGMILKNLYNIYPVDLPKEFGSICVMNKDFMELIPERRKLVENYKSTRTLVNPNNLEKSWHEMNVLFVGCYFPKEEVSDEQEPDQE